LAPLELVGSRLMAEPPNFDGRENAGRFQQAIDAVAAVGGVLLLLYGLGGTFTALRLMALDLPVDATVATLPKSSLLIASLRSIGPGLAFALSLWLLTRSWRSERRGASAGTRRKIEETVLLLVGVAVVGPLLLYRQQIPLLSVWGAIPVFLLLVGVRLIWFARRAWRARTDLALIVILTGIVVNGVADYIPPTPLDYVTVRLKDGGATDGFYLASDSNALYLAPNVFNHTVGDVSVIPRGQVASFKVESYKDQFRKVYGWDHPHFDSPSKQEVFNFVLGVRTDPQWVYPPVAHGVSANFLVGRSEFYDNKPHPYEPAGNGAAERVALDDVLLDPGLYTGREILTHGRVTRDAPSLDGKRLVVVRPRKRDDGRLAYCEYVPAPGRSLKPETRVRLRAVLVATGLFRNQNGEPVDGAALACAHVGN
jgi:hypothetical protein